MKGKRPFWLKPGISIRRLPCGRGCRVLKVDDSLRAALVKDGSNATWVSFETLGKAWRTGEVDGIAFQVASRIAMAIQEQGEWRVVETPDGLILTKVAGGPIFRVRVGGPFANPRIGTAEEVS